MIRAASPSLTRHDEVLEALRTAILSCAIEPGSRLVQEELAARLGVSRIPLREALRTLQGEGLVTIEPNRGAICRPLEPKDLSDLYDVRLALERLAVRTAADRFVDIQQSTAAKRLSAEAAIGRKDLPALIQRDYEFHSEIARRTGNLHLAKSLNGYWSQIRRAMHHFFTIGKYPEGVWAEHTAIARAIAVGDADRAANLLETHIVASRNAILRSLQRGVP